MGNGELNDSFLDINKHVINFCLQQGNIYCVDWMYNCADGTAVFDFSKVSVGGRWLESDLHASSIKEE